jgi:diacylglycerol kinase
MSPPSLDDLAVNITDSGYESFGDFMAEIEQSMKNIMQKSYKVPTDFSENWQAFITAIDWNDKLFTYLLVFHLSLAIIVLATRKHINFQGFLFILLCGLVFLSERINTYCSLNWRNISSQNYFDEKGAFAGIFFAGPLLLILFVQLINFLIIASKDLIAVKRLQLAKNRKVDEKAKIEELDQKKIQ